MGMHPDAATKSFVKDFRTFMLKGNVVDLAIGVVIGAAFGKIVSAFVDDLIMPVVSLVLPSGDWRDFTVPLRAGVKDAPSLKVGHLLGTGIDFFIIALVVFVT